MRVFLYKSIIELGLDAKFAHLYTNYYNAQFSVLMRKLRAARP